MSAAAPTLLSYIEETIYGLAPWLRRIGLSASGALAIRSAASRTEIEGGERGGVLTTSDTGGKYAFDPGVPATTAPAMYYLPPGSITPVLVTLLPAGSTVGGTVPPLAAAFGTAVVLGPGSQKVSSG